MREVLLILLLASPAYARPADGDYSNMERGKVVAIAEGVPSCTEKLSTDEADKARERMRDLFVSTHVRVTPKALEVAGIDTTQPGTPLAEVERTDSYVVGWLDMSKDRDGGRLWELAGVMDPNGTLHDQMQIGFAVRGADGALVCGDAVVGIAMRQDLKTEKKPAPKKPAPKKKH